MPMLELNAGDLGSLLRAIGGDNDDRRSGKVLPEAAIARLKEFYDRTTEDNPFSEGDVITPRADSPITGKGEPHVVIEVFDPYDSDRVKMVHSSMYSHDAASRPTMRIATLSQHDSIVVYLAEHWNYEIWDEERHGKRDGSAPQRASGPPAWKTANIGDHVRVSARSSDFPGATVEVTSTDDGGDGMRLLCRNGAGDENWIKNIHVLEIVPKPDSF